MFPSAIYDQVPLFQQINQYDIIAGKKKIKSVSRFSEMLALENMCRRLEATDTACHLPVEPGMRTQLIRWVISLVGFPATADGNLCPETYIGHLIALKAARDAHGINSTNVKKAVIYLSAHTHYGVRHALNITGLHEAVLRPVPLNDAHQLNSLELLRIMQEDVEQGLTPFLVVGVAGTSHTGAIDPLHDIAAICRQHSAWFHVDAGYGGFFMLVDDLKATFRGIEKASSLVMEPYKAMFVPGGPAIVIVRNRRDLLELNPGESNLITDDYTLAHHSVGEIAADGGELLNGFAPFSVALEEKVLLCRYLRKELKSAGFETGPEPDLSVTIFRLPGDISNDLNKKLVNALHENGRPIFTPVTIGGKLWIRYAINHLHIHLAEVNEALSMLKAVAGNINKD